MSVERLLNFLEMEIYTSKGKVSSIDFRTAKFKNLSFNDSAGTGKSSLLHKRQKKMKSSLIPFNKDLLMIIVKKFLEDDEKGALFKYINLALFPQINITMDLCKQPEEASKKVKGEILLRLLLDMRTFKKNLKTALNILFIQNTRVIRI